MVNIGYTLKQMAKPGFWKRSYEQADQEPSFSLKCLDIAGYAVADTSSEEASRVLGTVLQDGEVVATQVYLLFLPVEGVRVLGKGGEELLSFKITDIAYGGTDAIHPQYFFIVSNHQDALRCHFFVCEDGVQAKTLLLSLHETFSRVQCMLENNNECSTLSPSSKETRKRQEIKRSNPSSPKNAGKDRTNSGQVPCPSPGRTVPSPKSDASHWKLNLPRKLLPQRRSWGHLGEFGEGSENDPLL